MFFSFSSQAPSPPTTPSLKRLFVSLNHLWTLLAKKLKSYSNLIINLSACGTSQSPDPDHCAITPACRCSRLALGISARNGSRVCEVFQNVYCWQGFPLAFSFIVQLFLSEWNVLWSFGHKGGKLSSGTEIHSIMVKETNKMNPPNHKNPLNSQGS